MNPVGSVYGRFCLLNKLSSYQKGIKSLALQMCVSEAGLGCVIVIVIVKPARESFHCLFVSKWLCLPTMR